MIREGLVVTVSDGHPDPELRGARAVVLGPADSPAFGPDCWVLRPFRWAGGMLPTARGSELIPAPSLAGSGPPESGGGLTVSRLVREAWETAEEKGFHEADKGDPRTAALVKFAFIHTEVSEGTQEVKRHGVTDPAVLRRIGLELADTAIRMGDFAGCYGIDLEALILEKLAYNRTRPRLYGTPGAAAADGGGAEPCE